MIKAFLMVLILWIPNKAASEEGNKFVNQELFFDTIEDLDANDDEHEEKLQDIDGEILKLKIDFEAIIDNIGNLRQFRTELNSLESRASALEIDKNSLEDSISDLKAREAIVRWILSISTVLFGLVGLVLGWLFSRRFIQTATDAASAKASLEMLLKFMEKENQESKNANDIIPRQ